MSFPAARSLLLSTALAWSLLLAPLAPAQEAPTPAAPAAPVAPAVPSTPAAPAEVAAAVEAPAPEVAPAPAPPPLRRLDEPGIQESTTTTTTTIVRVSYSDNEFPVGDHTVPAGRVARDVVSILGSSRVEGEALGDAVSIGGNTTVAPGARVGGGAVAILGRLRVEGDVRRDAVSVLGGVYLNAPIGGGIVSILGDLELGPQAVVGRDIVLVGGRLIKHPDAIVRGKQINVTPLGALGNLDELVQWITHCLVWGRLLAFDGDLAWAWGIAVLFLGLYVGLALIFRRSMERCVTTLLTRPGRSILASIFAIVLVPIAIVLLSITVIGIPLLPFLVVGLFCAALFGKAVMLAVLGRPFTRAFGDGPLGHVAASVFIGGVLAMFLYAVPVIGLILFKILGWLGFGVVAYTLILASKREKPASASATSTSTPPPFTPPPAAPGAPGAPRPPVVPVVPVVPVASVPLHAVPVEIVTDAPSDAGVPPPVAAVPPTEATPLPPEPPASAPPPASGATVPPYTPPPYTPPTPPPAPSARSTAASRPADALLPRVGFWPRLLAMLLDLFLVSFTAMVLSEILPYRLRVHNPPGLLVWVAVYAALMWKLRGTTVGGIICGQKVVRLDGRPLDWPTAIVRALGCFLSLIVAGLGFIWVAFDDEKQSWHDKIAGTTVVRIPKGTSLV